MKKILILFSAAALVMSCGNSEGDSNATTGDSAAGTTNTTTTAPAPAAAANADADKGLELIAQNDCLACHKVEEKMTGPAYREIAAKYPNNQETIDSLAAKIIRGGSGVWGQQVMTPHPTLSKEDAQTMVKYVMSLKQ